MSKIDFQSRVELAAKNALKLHGAVGPLEFLQEMKFLDKGAVELWKRGNSSHHTAIEPFIQCGPEKLAKSLRDFELWAKKEGLEPIELQYYQPSREGKQALQVTVDGNPDREKWFRSGYRKPGLTDRQKQKLEDKLNRAPDLVVFQTDQNDVECVECKASHQPGDMYFVEKEQAICLECADLDHLEFLPRGDVAMTRRAKKHSPLSAIVLRFNRRRKKWDRQGLLVTAQAIETASLECLADADKRAVHRAKGALRRSLEDEQLISDFTKSIQLQFPGCPTSEAEAIAQHAAVRGSGRVGRSAAGRAVELNAVHLAVRAWIRHQHTDYDRRLMNGEPRMDARASIRDDLERVYKKWQG